MSCSLFKMSSLNSFWRYLRYFPLITSPVLVRRPVPRFNWSSWGISVRVPFLTLGRLRNLLKDHYWNNRVIFSSSYPLAAVSLLLYSNNDRSEYMYNVFNLVGVLLLFFPHPFIITNGTGQCCKICKYYFHNFVSAAIVYHIRCY